MPSVSLRDAVVVIDIEATCWQGGGVPQGQRNEIIEIGACLVDVETGTVSAPTSFLVKPVVSTLDPFCTELTSITPQMLEADGLTFDEACARLVEQYRTPERLWGSWGNYDRNLFISQCAQAEVPYPFGKAHVNLKKVFMRFASPRQSMGMKEALAHLEIPLVGTHHRGGDDAYNTGQILSVLLARHGGGVLKKYWK